MFLKRPLFCRIVHVSTQFSHFAEKRVVTASISGCSSTLLPLGPQDTDQTDDIFGVFNRLRTVLTAWAPSSTGIM